MMPMTADSVGWRTRRQNDVAGVVKLANQHRAEPIDRLDAIIRGERLRFF